MMASSVIHNRHDGCPAAGLLHTSGPPDVVLLDYNRCSDETAIPMTMDYRLSRTSFTHLESTARDRYGNEGTRYGPEQGLRGVSPCRPSTVSNGKGGGGGGGGGSTSSSSGDESSGSGHRSCNDVTTENRTGTGSSGNDGRPEVGVCFGGGAMMTKTDDEDSSREMSRQWTEEEAMLLSKGFPEEGPRKNKAQKQVFSFRVNKHTSHRITNSSRLYY